MTHKSITGKMAWVNPYNISRYHDKQLLYLVNSLNTCNIMKFKDFILANWNAFMYFAFKDINSFSSCPYFVSYADRIFVEILRKRSIRRVFNSSHVCDSVQRKRDIKNKLDLLVHNYFLCGFVLFLFYGTPDTCVVLYKHSLALIENSRTYILRDNHMHGRVPRLVIHFYLFEKICVYRK